MRVGKLGLEVGAASLVLFLIVTILVFSNTTQSLDAQDSLAIDNFDLGAALTELMVLFAEYGREYFWIPVVGVMLVLGNRDTKLLAIELAALFLAGILLGEAMKLVTCRPRPLETLDAIVLRLPADTTSSYPSGHALIASIGGAFSLVKFKRKSIALLLTLEAAMVCYSRVYVGAHYPLDVVAGIFLALGIVGSGSFILERYLEPLLERLTALTVRILGDGPLKL